MPDCADCDFWLFPGEEDCPNCRFGFAGVPVGEEDQVVAT